MKIIGERMRSLRESIKLSPAMVADYTLQLPDKKLLEAKLREITMLTEGTDEE